MPECPRCETRYSGAARLCRNCGGPLPEVPAAPSGGGAVVDKRVGIRVCGRCGRIVPTTRPRCADHTDVESKVVAARPDGAVWARVSCTYLCGGCKVRVPLATFDAAAASVCTICNHVQAQPLVFWRVVLGHAHAVADLRGEAGTPFADVGVEISEARAEDERTRDDDDVPRDLSAAPGWPPCPRCATPLAGTWAAGSPCASCGEVLGCAPQGSERVNKALRAIVGEPRAAIGKPTAGGAVVALTCPTCSAPLTVPDAATQATCKYCSTTSLIRRAATSASPTSGDGEPARAWCWLLFEGPSRKRGDLAGRS